MNGQSWKRFGWTPLGSLPPAQRGTLAAIATGLAGRAIAGPTRRVRELQPEVDELASSQDVTAWAGELLGGPPRLVRALWFDKPARRNWPVQWHQDKTVCVAERHEVPGFGPWSVKGGIPHVEPPLEVLQRMATIRLHLDACTAENGPLRVISGSHTAKLSRNEIEQRVAEAEAEELHVEPFGALAMRPLLLHASRRAIADGHRRVLHLEFATGGLPAPLQWRE